MRTRSIIVFLLLLQLGGCATTVELEPDRIASVEEAMQVLDSAMEQQPERLQPLAYEVSQGEIVYYGRDRIPKRLVYSDIADQQLYLKSDIYRLHILDSSEQRIFAFYTADQGLAEQFMAALETMREYTLGLSDEERQAIPPPSKIFESTDSIEPAWDGVKIVPHDKVSDCQFIQEQRCKTSLGGGSRCKNWHLERAGKYRANAVMIGDGSGGFSFFSITGYNYYLPAKYYWCSKASQAGSSTVPDMTGIEVASSTDGTVIGSWIDESQSTMGLILLVDNAGAFSLVSRYGNGLSTSLPLTEQAYRDGRKFIGPDVVAEYFVLTDDGRLQVWDNMGIVREFN